MRWALLADVHANLEALRAVLRDLEGWPDHRLVCAGDLVGYGPDPEGCLDELVSRDAVCVLGNHDAMVLGRLDFQHCIAPGIRAAVWTRRTMSTLALARLAALPGTARPSPELFVCHSAPGDLERRVSDADAVDAVLDATPRGCTLVVSGHTHHAAFQRRGGAFQLAAPGTTHTTQALCFVNPGSVGQPRDGKLLARYARFDPEAQTVTFHAVAYDAVATLAKLKRRGLTPRVVYSERFGRLDRARTRLARLLHRPLSPL
jgi:predicted phosphodiesterase